MSCAAVADRGMAPAASELTITKKEVEMFARIGIGTLLAGSLLVGGCSSSTEIDNPFAGGDSNAPRLAAYAAQASYPSTRPSTDLKATALINRDKGTIRIVNASDRAIRDATVWVNGSFVRYAGTIPANSTFTLSREQFYNRDGRKLSAMSVSVNRVQLQTQDGFYDLQGPVAE
jgi:hypothetical protein